MQDLGGAPSALAIPEALKEYFNQFQSTQMDCSVEMVDHLHCKS
jgi:hypothetical protein